jgi:FkbM family methyltransferase
VIADRLRDLIARVPVLRRAVKSPPGQHLVQTVRGAGVVHERLRFAAHQVGPSRVGEYRLRQSGLRVFVRHRNDVFAAATAGSPTDDVHILNEIFGGTGGQYAYDPPPPLAARLDAMPRLKAMDLGANIGLFGVYAFGRWPRAEVHSFEPDPTNQQLLKRVIAANALGGRWSLTEAAVANYTGEMTFASGLFADSHPVTGDDPGADANGAGGVQDTITVPTLDLFDQDHDVDLIKMDIEGGEWSILTDPRLPELGADVIVLEWHARGCPQPDARTAAASLLRDAGYTAQQEVEIATYNGVLWAWRED